MSVNENIDQINRMYGLNLQYPAQKEEEISVPEDSSDRCGRTCRGEAFH